MSKNTEFFISFGKASTMISCESGIDSINRYQVVSNPGAIYLGTHGRGIWRSDDVLHTNELKPIEANEELTINHLNIFPNPITKEGKVYFELSKRTDVHFKIFDLQGKIMQTKISNLWDYKP